MQHRAKRVNVAASAPRAHAAFTESRSSPTQCVTVCVSERSVPWQCGQSGPFKSPWAAGESPKKDSTGQNETKTKNNTAHSTKMSPICRTTSYVHLKTKFSFLSFFFLHGSILSLEYKNRFLMFFCLWIAFFLLWEKIEIKLHVKIYNAEYKKCL